MSRCLQTGSWLLAVSIAGCGGAATETDTMTRSEALRVASGAEAGAPQDDPPPAAALSAPGNCEALLAALQADLLARARQRAAQARQWPYDVAPDGYPGGVARDTAPSPALQVETAGGEAPATEVEEGGVLEVDSDHVYLVDTESATPRLVVLRAVPGQPLGVLATVAIEGTPLALFARQGRLLVFSRIAGVPPDIYEGLPDYEPVFTKLTLLQVDTGTDTRAGTGVDAGADTGTDAPPQTERELYIEGEYVSARRSGGVVRAVIQHVPKLRLDAPLVSDTDILGRDRPQAQIDAQVDAWLAITEASVVGSGLDAYLPSVYERHGGVLVARAPSCDGTFVPGPGRVEPGAISVFSLDLGASELATHTEIHHARASADGGGALSSFTVFGYPSGIALDPGAAVIHHTRRVEGPGEAPRGESDLHLFELDAERARYVAAGSIAGSVSVVDRQPGALRVLASESIYVQDRFFGHEHRALALAVEGKGLSELGSTIIAGVNEPLGEVRFVGDHAYLFTTNVAGPGFGLATGALVALDLSDPAAPRETGRLPLPPSSGGPLPAGGAGLLSVTSVPEPDEIGSHPELWLFQVGGADAPALGARYAWPPTSSVSGDRRSIGFSPDRARFALPVRGVFSSSFDVFELSPSGLARIASIVPDHPEPTLVQCLELHGMPTDPDTIAALEADPPALALELVQCNLDWPRPYVQRGLLRAQDAIVLSYSYGDSRWTGAAYALDALGAPPVSQIDF